MEQHYRYTCQPRKRTRASSLADYSPQPKKARYDEVTESVIANINKIVEDPKKCDVTFIVGINGDTQEINGIRALFAAQSDVLNSMLYGNMRESTSKQITIDNITKDAFEYIKNIAHLSSPSLQFRHIVDILFAAQKYMIESIKKKCEQKILSMNDLDTFYLIMDGIKKYAPSTFEGILNDIMECEYVTNHIDDIIESEKFHLLKIFQVRLLSKLISVEFTKYQKIKAFCTTYCKPISIGENEDVDMSHVTWQHHFLLHFIDCVDFQRFSLNELMTDVRSDKVISDSQILELTDGKIKELQEDSNEYCENYHDVKQKLEQKQIEYQSLQSVCDTLKSDKQCAQNECNELRTEKSKNRECITNLGNVLKGYNIGLSDQFRRYHGLE